MLELLYATGIRVSELIALDVDDLNLPAGVLHCESKGRERIIPLYHTAIRALSDYITQVRPQLVESPEETALFVNMSGERMSRQGFWKLIKHYQEKAGIQKTLLPIRCATPLPPTCWRTVRICAPSRRCWVTRISPPLRSTPDWSARSSRTCTTRHTPERNRTQTVTPGFFQSRGFSLDKFILQA